MDDFEVAIPQDTWIEQPWDMALEFAKAYLRRSLIIALPRPVAASGSPEASRRSTGPFGARCVSGVAARPEKWLRWSIVCDRRAAILGTNDDTNLTEKAVHPGQKGIGNLRKSPIPAQLTSTMAR